MKVHVELPLQLAVSQGPRALHVIAVPVQWPRPSHLSPYVHGFMSSQVVLAALPSQKLTQFGMVVPLQMPLWQESLAVQRKPSSHTVPSVLNASAGQVDEVPVQACATSHWPAAARQTVPAATNESGGHAGSFPGQFSATSQTPAEGRQTVVPGLN